jgi:N-acetylglucosamine-6-phosphate deacetylase
MSQMTGRAPGLVGAALASEATFAGIICDGFHVAPESVLAAWRAMGRRRLFLVSDAMPTVGGASTEFRLHGRLIRLSGGRLTDDTGTLAGAHLSMAEAVRYASGTCGLPLADALAMATSTPAALLGLGAEIGWIRTGCRADLCAIGQAGVSHVWQSGRRVG